MVERAQPFSLRVSEASLVAYKKAAEEAGLSVSEWARLVLDAASGASKIAEHIERTKDARKVRDGKW